MIFIIISTNCSTHRETVFFENYNLQSQYNYFLNLNDCKKIHVVDSIYSKSYDSLGYLEISSDDYILSLAMLEHIDEIAGTDYFKDKPDPNYMLYRWTRKEIYKDDIKYWLTKLKCDTLKK
jgi:hypothetical protein